MGAGRGARHAARTRLGSSVQRDVRRCRACRLRGRRPPLAPPSPPLPRLQAGARAWSLMAASRSFSTALQELLHRALRRVARAGRAVAGVRQRPAVAALGGRAQDCLAQPRPDSLAEEAPALAGCAASRCAASGPCRPAAARLALIHSTLLCPLAAGSGRARWACPSRWVAGQEAPPWKLAGTGSLGDCWGAGLAPGRSPRGRGASGWQEFAGLAAARRCAPRRLTVCRLRALPATPPAEHMPPARPACAPCRGPSRMPHCPSLPPLCPPPPLQRPKSLTMDAMECRVREQGE